MIKNCDFSLKHYFDVLVSLKNEYAIGALREFERLKKSKKFIILRHDVDFSLEYALELAEKESEHKIRSTYFVLFNGEYYNPFDSKNSKIIKEISDLGHEIGLHYDTSFLPKSSRKEIEIIKKEINMLEIITHKKIISVAQHVPSETRRIFTNLKNEGFIDSRSPEIIKQVKYISDSSHYWREGCMCQNVKKFDRLQILTHPIWWVNNSNKRNGSLLEFENKKKQEITRKINDYKDMVNRLLIKLKAPNDEFE